MNTVQGQFNRLLASTAVKNQSRARTTPDKGEVGAVG